MAISAGIEPPGPLTSAQRADMWARLDTRPEVSELFESDSEELSQIRKITDHDLREIARGGHRSGAPAKDLMEFLDATSVARALETVACERFERDDYDGAARSAINALRWHAYARDLHDSASLTLPLPSDSKLWMLLAETYQRLGEQRLAHDTARRIVQSQDSGLIGLIATAARSAIRPQLGGYLSVRSGRDRRRYVRLLVLWAAIVLIGLSTFVALRAQSTAKGMIDDSSTGVEFLQIALRNGLGAGNQDSLVLAAEDFSSLGAKLDSWSWVIGVSKIIPPIHAQFAAMDRIGELGRRIVAASLLEAGSERTGTDGSVRGICRAADDLRAVRGNLIDQVEENRQAILALVPVASGGACG